jgi:hypothetical protein
MDCRRIRVGVVVLAGSVILLSTGVVLPPSSSGLGHHPFKVAARVRIPLGVPDHRGQTRGPVVKLEFTPACQAGGRGFESRRDRQVGGCRNFWRCVQTHC